MANVDNPSKFASKYRVLSSRKANWNYSSSGIYFITICTYRHNNFFGKIINHQMELSKMGMVVKSELLKTFEIRKNIKLHDYVIMPNHIHLLMEIKYQIKNNNHIDHIETARRDILNNCRDVARYVSTLTDNVSTKEDNKNFSNISPKPNSISSIIRSFKSAVTKQINPKTIFFAWQPRYHDIIIKDEKQYFTIKTYIENNVINWDKDKFFNRNVET